MCKISLKKKTIPKFFVPIDVRKNDPINNVQVLTQLEEHLMSSRIAFVQIYKLGYKKSQIGLIGSNINIPINIDII